jgi:hypothetical protein
MKKAPSDLGIDANFVAGDLFQGAFPPLDDRLDRCTDVVVFAASELQPTPNRARRVTRIFAPNDDDGTPMTSAQWAIAKDAAVKVRRHLDRGRRVLVTCHAGLNRSGLISAMAMMLPPSQGARCGRTPSCLRSSEAIYLVRAARGPMALSNKEFEKVLHWLSGKLCPGARPVFSPRLRL